MSARCAVRAAISDAARVLVNDPNHDDVTEALLLARPELGKLREDSERLEKARRAYMLAESAQLNIQRLKKYARKTEGMKRDLQRYQATYAENSQLHDKIMRGLL